MSQKSSSSLVDLVEPETTSENPVILDSEDEITVIPESSNSNISSGKFTLKFYHVLLYT